MLFIVVKQYVLSAVEDDTQGKEDVNNDPFSKDVLPETDTVYYMEIKRVNATTIEQRVYTTSDYSTDTDLVLQYKIPSQK